ncbi:amino acid permease [Bacillus licheniformis]|nr:amino acid permease [Bacillus licheniformis]
MFAPDSVYIVLVSISGFAVVAVWMSIAASQFMFRRRFLAEGNTADDLKYRTPLYPAVPIAAFLLCLDIMNFVILTALLSAANSGLYACSRMLWSLSKEKTLHPVFQKLTSRGIPLNALIFSMLGGILSLLSRIGIAAGESAEPEKNIPKAIKTTLWRLVLFFIGTIFVLSCLIPVKEAGVIKSPFVDVFDRIGVPYAASIKVLAIILFIILGGAAIFGIIPIQNADAAPLLSNFAGEGGLFPNGFLPIFMAMLSVNFAFSGTELGFTVAWLYWLTWAVALGSEFTAAGLLMQRWFPDTSVWMWSAVFAALIFALNAVSVRFFAESEFWFSGVIGTGLFLSSGYTISQAGPAGTILAYLAGALIVYLVMLCLGELSVAMPVTGSFHMYASRFIGPGTFRRKRPQLV